MTDLSEILFYTSITILSLYILLQGVSMVSLFWLEDEEGVQIPENELPFISILVAARNEEQNIWRCLSALNQLNYPKDKIEFLIGNDQSNDRTLEIAEAYTQKHPRFKVFNITDSMGMARGKANVLAHLARLAQGEFYFITDADIAVNKNWARELLAYFEEDTAIVSGTTVVDDEGTMGKMQEVDWMYYMGLLKSAYNLGLSCTAVGNNMAIRKEAYWEVGGYETLNFSITEDYKLYKEVRLRGWGTKNVLNPQVINYSRAIHQFRVLLAQRKRWLTGAKELPLFWWFLFMIFGMFTPAIILLAFLNLKLALIFYLIKLSCQSITIYELQSKMRLDKNIDFLLTYEFYNTAVVLATGFYYILPIRLQWKNRTYTL